MYKRQDQGVMVGYACDETPQLMPMPTVLAHRITRELSACRRSGYIKDIFSDGKAQVTVEYEDGKPVRLEMCIRDRDTSVTADDITKAVSDDTFAVETSIDVYKRQDH